MKHNLITIIGVIAIVAGIVVVRSVFEQTPGTVADTKESAEAAESLEEAKAITEDATDTAKSASQDDGHDHDHDHNHDHGNDGNHGETAMAKADGEAGAATDENTEQEPTPSSADEFEVITEWPEEAPDVYRVKFDTSTGPYVIEVTKAWAPIGAEHFYELCKVGYFEEARYFRVIFGFMVQFGLAADPKLTAQYKDKKLMDEPVRKSNQRGKITFAKSNAPNSRTTQVFINYGDNSRLDSMGFAPFGEVIFGMENVDKITDEYGERPNQGEITAQGNAYLARRYPNLDYIKKVTLVK